MEFTELLQILHKRRMNKKIKDFIHLSEHQRGELFFAKIYISFLSSLGFQSQSNFLLRKCYRLPKQPMIILA